MLPGRLASYRVHRGQVVPDFLGPHDHPWLRALLDEFERHAGRPERLLRERLREPLRRPSPPGRRRMAIHVLWPRCRAPRPSSPPLPRSVRAALFPEAARLSADVRAAWQAASRRLGQPERALRARLFADLPGERRVAAPPPDLSPVELALRTNLALAKALLFRAARVVVDLEGNARAVVRYAQLRGLLCTVTGWRPSRGARLRLSGPFSLFRRTLVYGRALGDLLPQLSWCTRFSLTADCILRDQTLALELSSRDPVFPSAEPRRFDSKIEARFARDFARLAPDWDVVREPQPVRAGTTLVFPDFLLTPRASPERRWLLEIVGFWTRDYLESKLRRLRAAGLDNLILCIDADRNCGEEDLPAGARVLRFRKRVDAGAVLALVTSQTSLEADDVV